MRHQHRRMENQRCWAWARFAGTFALFVILCGTLGEGTKLRHYRHLDIRSENSSLNKSAIRDDKYLHKPYFYQCSKYHPVIKEMEPRFSFVIQVHADDPDPEDQGGKITYSLERERYERLKFDIDESTGVVRTFHVLDRDEPFREKEFWLTVIATDNGYFRLSDMCSFKVTVEDINDNEPFFNRVYYKESIPKDLGIGKVAMEISATDLDDGDNAAMRYSLQPSSDNDYFKINSQTGEIFLNKTIDKEPGHMFKLRARVTDMGKEPKHSEIDLHIFVVESHKKAPSFTKTPNEPIKILESFRDVDATIVRLEAVSNIDDKPRVLFSLLTGGTEQMNKLGTFKLNSSSNFADIKLAQMLDYERNTEYTLIVRVKNDYNLATETKVNIKVVDVNDNSPVFGEIKSGTVLENEPRGVSVMQVRASDADGTFEHNQVSYELGNYQDLFAIDKKTGNITTLIKFDRETEDIYDLKVIATDSSPSANSKSGEHNYQESNFRIVIADRNDNAPHFNQSIYTAPPILENINIYTLIVQVYAEDKDTASSIHYSIISGNNDGSFVIEEETGKIRVNQSLDYETQTEYNLIVRAFDGLYDDNATVKIFIDDVNDNPPKFEDFDKNPTIEEETLVKGCITTVRAYDPDIRDRNADQHIVYSITNEEHQSLIGIDKLGCMTLKKPLNRDLPNGRSMWAVIVKARDADGSPSALQALIEVNITLIDINDNAPFLDMPQPVVWNENQEPGKITKLKARDYDSDENGPPFKFRIDMKTAGEEITKNFKIIDDELYALKEFDREEQKSYNIPIEISDSGYPTMTGTSILLVVIGDENDNKMREGASSIFVYNYKGEAPNTKIGRVYVEDEDDWDLPDKHFNWDGKPTNGFYLNPNDGMITLLSGTQNGSYDLRFNVTEESAHIPRHTVQASVIVTVKEIPEEAVTKSGSVRLFGITEAEFVIPNESGKSIKDRFQEQFATMLNRRAENIDVFTVLHSPHQNNKSLLDVRFSAHGSPYYAAEKLNTILTQHSKEIESELGLDIMLINIDECLFEKAHCNTSCRSFLNVSTEPYSVYTNTSSFVGVRAIVDPQCTCHVAEPIVCLNNGTLVAGHCKCPPGRDGPRCELLDISFQGDGWAIMPPPGQACDESHLGLDVTTHDNGLVFYFGPMSYNPKLGIQDFMALEVQNGAAVLYVDYGTGTAKLIHNETKLTNGSSHRIDVYWTKTSIEIKVDNCEKSACMRLTAPVGTNEFLNVNSPLQIGGSWTNLEDMAKNFGWDHTPTDKGFVGCIKNLTINGNTYNLGMPALSKNASPGCYSGRNAAVSFSVQSNFLVAILVCVTILLILLLAVVVHRRKRDDLYKDMDDIRENIINYEDEGGGEVDTGFDLNVLRRIYDAPPIDSKIAPSVLQGRAPDEVPDICGFLDSRKDSCDKDPDTNPFDDVRHYAYEGEGNSDGSLSSLASCTDDGDLKFNYLSNFGPRFRKLADMYGEEPSDEESDGVEERESESWC